MLISFMVTCGNKSAFLEWDYFIGQTQKKEAFYAWILMVPCFRHRKGEMISKEQRDYGMCCFACGCLFFSVSVFFSLTLELEIVSPFSNLSKRVRVCELCYVQ